MTQADEAHRLSQRRNLSSYEFFDKTNEKLGLDKELGTQLDWILNSAKHVVLFYDHNQSVKPSDIDPNKFSELDANWFSLKTQMRVKAGNEYSIYVENVMKVHCDKRLEFDQYELRLFDDVQMMIDEIKLKDSQFGLSRVVAGYAWDWKSKNEPTAFDIQIGDYAYKWNSVNGDWINSANALNEIGCIHTVQGYDLNYVGVIIGPELIYTDGRIIFLKEKYKDRYGKHNSKSDSDMLNYVINIYKTLMTRGILGTYIFVCDDGLRSYLKGYF